MTTSTNTAVAGDFLAEAPPVITGAAAAGILHALGLSQPTADTWTTDPAVRRGITLGRLDLAGGGR